MTGMGRSFRRREPARLYAGAVVEVVKALGVVIGEGCRGTVLRFEDPNPSEVEHRRTGGWVIDFINNYNEPHQVTLSGYTLEQLRVLSPLEVLAEQAE